MAITLAEANRHSTNRVVKGVLEEIYQDEYVLKLLPFEETSGIALQYVRESSLGNAGSFIDPNEVIPESTGTTAQVTVALKIMADHADIDNFLASTRSNYYDFASEIIKMKAKKFRQTFMSKFYYGSSAANTKEFDGLHTLTVSGMQLHQGSGSTPAALSLANLDALIDLHRGGDADSLHMVRAIRRGITQYIRLNGTLITDRDQWGKMVLFYNSVPVYVDDNLVATEAISAGAFSAETGGTNTGSVFSVKYGNAAVFGLQNKGGLSVRKIADTLEAKDSARWRLRWWVSVGLGSTQTLGRLDGISTTSAVTA